MIRHYQIRVVYPVIGTIASVALLFIYWNTNLQTLFSLLFISIGLIIWWSATITLGKSFSVVPQARELIQSGMYSVMRHPIYVGISLTTIGWAILTSSYLFILLAIAAAVSSVARAKLEEKKLMQTFGEKYLAYKKKTWF